MQGLWAYNGALRHRACGHLISGPSGIWVGGSLDFSLDYHSNSLLSIPTTMCPLRQVPAFTVAHYLCSSSCLPCLSSWHALCYPIYCERCRFIYFPKTRNAWSHARDLRLMGARRRASGLLLMVATDCICEWVLGPRKEYQLRCYIFRQ